MDEKINGWMKDDIKLLVAKDARMIWWAINQRMPCMENRKKEQTFMLANVDPMNVVVFFVALKG